MSLRVITMRKDGLMSWAEIAKKTNLTEKQVKREYDNAMRKLKVAFNAIGVNGDDVDFVEQLRQGQEEVPPEVLLKTKESR